MKDENDLELYMRRIKLMHLLAQIQTTEVSTKEEGLVTLRQVYAENQKYENKYFVYLNNLQILFMVLNRFMRSLPLKNPDLLDEHRKFSLK